MRRDAGVRFCFSRKDSRADGFVRLKTEKSWSISHGKNGDSQSKPGLLAAVPAWEKDRIAVCYHLPAQDQTQATQLRDYLAGSGVRRIRKLVEPPSEGGKPK